MMDASKSWCIPPTTPPGHYHNILTIFGEIDRVSKKISDCVRVEVVISIQTMLTEIENKEACVTQRQSIRLASNLDRSIFTQCKR